MALPAERFREECDSALPPSAMTAAELALWYSGAIPPTDDPEATFEADECPIADGELTSREANAMREQALLSIVHCYARHPSVSSRLEQYRTHVQEEWSDDPRHRYGQEIAQYRLLTDEETAALARQIVSGLKLLSELEDGTDIDGDHEHVFLEAAAAYKILYTCNLRLVIHIAEKYAWLRALPLMDLISAGNEALGEAICRYDPDEGASLAHFAWRPIRTAISRAVAATSRTIRISYAEHNRWINLCRAVEELRKEEGHEPADTEIARRLGVQDADVEEIRRVGALTLLSLNSHNPVRNKEMGEMFVAPDEHEPDSPHRLLMLDVRTAFAALTEPQQRVITLRYGLDDGEERTQHEVGEALDVTGARIGQIEKPALRLMRRKMGIAEPTDSNARSKNYINRK